MAVYFSIDKSTGNGNGTINVTPLSTFKGRGPVTNTLVVTSDDDSSVKGSVTCSKTNALSMGSVTTTGCASATGTYSAVTVSSNTINIPNTAYFLKFAVAATNAKKISVSMTPTYLAVKVGSQWVQTDGTLGSNQVDVKGQLSSNLLTIPNDPGLTSEYALEVVVGFSAQTAAATRTYSLTLAGTGTSDSTTKNIFAGSVVQAAASPTLTVSPTSLSWGDSETSAKSVTVTSNDDWAATIS